MDMVTSTMPVITNEQNRGVIMQILSLFDYVYCNTLCASRSKD